jgi:hypothetical protein
MYSNNLGNSYRGEDVQDKIEAMIKKLELFSV